MITVWHQSTARAIRKQSDPMHSNRSRGTLMSYGDHSAQRRFKLNAPTVSGSGACRCTALRTVRTMSAQTDLRFASQTFQQLVAMCPVSLSTEPVMPLIMNLSVNLLTKSISTYKYHQIKTEIRLYAPLSWVWVCSLQQLIRLFYKWEYNEFRQCFTFKL